jgi:hypothetical protein
MRKILLVLIFLVVSMPAVFARDYTTTITYNMGIPTMETANFVSEFSWLGFGIEGRRFVEENISVGFAFHWNVFSERKSGTKTFPQGAFTGTSIGYINAFPMMLSIDYYTGNDREARAFFGLQAGTQYIDQRLEVGVLAFNTYNWHLALTPEFGFMFPVDRNTNFFTSIRYNYCFDSGDNVIGQEDNTVTYFGINIGFNMSY